MEKMAGLFTKINLSSKAAAIAIIGALPYFSVSQKTLIPLLIILTGLSILTGKDKGIDWRGHKETSASKLWICMAIGFMLLTAKNAFNDIDTGLITGPGELIASLARASLYILAPLAVVNAAKRLAINGGNVAMAILSGIQLKVLTCLALTPILMGEAARKGFILQIPTLEKFVTTWTGTYFLLSTALVCFLFAQTNLYKNQIIIRSALLLFSALQAFYCAVALNNLTCTVAGFAMLTIGGFYFLNKYKKQQESINNQSPKRTKNNLKSQSIFALILFATITATAVATQPRAVSDSIGALRIEHLWKRNDRLEFLVQGTKRFFNHTISEEYLLIGPPSFQRPICFKDAEVTFTYGDSCHNYWHSILWDSLRNSGYIGLSLGIIITASLAAGFYKSVKEKKFVLSAGFGACILIIFTTPIVEVGAGEVLPLILVSMTLCSGLNSQETIASKSS